MLLSCSLLIRINGGHDTGFSPQPHTSTGSSSLTFSHASRIEVSRQLSFKISQRFVVSHTFQCLMFLQAALTSIQKVLWTRLSIRFFYQHKFWA